MANQVGYGGDSLPQDPALDEQFREEHLGKQDDPNYKKMQTVRQKLPIFNQKQAICNSIQDTRNQVTVISGETGCGKTTQVPQFILDEYLASGKGSQCHIVCTQPRRISAISVAHRVAEERAEKAGGNNSTVGFQIRMENEHPRSKGSILYCTTGIVLKWLSSDPWLASVSHIILDEIHERDIHSEFLLAIMQGILPIRKDLKLILMSATMDTGKFSRYYRNCPVFKIPGFLYPVQEHFLEDVVEMTGYRPSRTFRGQGNIYDFKNWLEETGFSYQTTATLVALKNNRFIDIDLIVALIRNICAKEPGAILVFLPGWDQITRLYEKLLEQHMFQSSSYLILTLHGGMMSMDEQKEVLTPAPPGVRKIVIATNVAETSITIDDIVYVIDCGKIKLSNYDWKRNMVTLEDHHNSRANSTQRKGRAGRLKPGHCYRLYTRFDEAHMKEEHRPEILRTRLEQLCLHIKLLNRGNIMSFFHDAMDPPPDLAIRRSIKHLRELSALDDAENLTLLGNQMALMPVDPHIAKMLMLGAIFGCLDPILTVAATLDYRMKSPFDNPVDRNVRKVADQRKREVADGSCSDYMMFINAYQGWLEAERGNVNEYLRRNFLLLDTLKEVKKSRNMFARVLHDIGFICSESPLEPDANYNSNNKKLIRAIICAGLYPNVGKVKTTAGTHQYGIQTKDEAVELHLKSVNHGQPMPYDFIIYFQKLKTAGKTNSCVFDSSGVSISPFVFFGENFQRSDLYGSTNVTIDSLISFRTTPSVALELEMLRADLWRNLEKKFENPCPTIWGALDDDDMVLRKVMQKISEDATYAMN